jgi:5-hydroxyisourate hydrolase
MTGVTTHVLDTARGLPASGVPVRLEAPDGSTAEAATDDDGRVTEMGAAETQRGTYRLIIDTATYFARTGQRGFYPEVVITFEVTEPGHHHVPLLLSPFAYSTYRGS